MSLFPSNSFCEVQTSSINGEGVFAKCEIESNVDFLMDRVIPFNVAAPIDFIPHRNTPNVIYDYVYPFSTECGAICIGIGSFFNHSNDPNAELRIIDIENKTFTFTTLRKICNNEEICIAYTGVTNEYDRTLE